MSDPARSDTDPCAEQVASPAWLEEVMREHARLKERLPHIDPDELLNILYASLRPFGSGRRFLLRARQGGGYVF